MLKLAIHSVPRSGSSWLGEIVNSSEYVNYSYQPLFSYRFKSFLSENSSNSEINDFFDLLKMNNDSFIRQEDDRKLGVKPIFYKSEPLCIAYKEVRYHNILENLLLRDEDLKLIALIRNPLSVIASWYSAPREFRKDLGWQLEDEIYFANKKNDNRKEEYFGLNKWIESTLLFERLHDKYKDRVLIVNYNDLILDVTNETYRIYDFLNLPVSEQVERFIETKLVNQGTYSVFNTKSADNGWEVVLPIKIQDMIIKSVEEASLKKYLK